MFISDLIEDNSSLSAAFSFSQFELRSETSNFFRIYSFPQRAESNLPFCNGWHLELQALLRRNILRHDNALISLLQRFSEVRLITP